MRSCFPRREARAFCYINVAHLMRVVCSMMESSIRRQKSIGSLSCPIRKCQIAVQRLWFEVRMSNRCSQSNSFNLWRNNADRGWLVLTLVSDSEGLSKSNVVDMLLTFIPAICNTHTRCLSLPVTQSHTHSQWTVKSETESEWLWVWVAFYMIY